MNTAGTISVRARNHSTPAAVTWNRRYAHQIDEALVRFLTEQTSTLSLTHGARYALGLDSELAEHRGKRIRPALCLLANESLGGNIQRAMPLAMACELLHTFLIVHDDIEDGDVMRRGRPAVWRQFGLAEGVNIGDFLAIAARRAVFQGRWDDATTLCLLRWINTALWETGHGQALDLTTRGQLLTRRQYMTLAYKKTGPFLALPMQGGAMLAGASDSVIAAIGTFAEALGCLYQISDDIIDLVGAKGREQVGTDIREGKSSLLVVIALEQASSKQRTTLLRILNKPREKTTSIDIAVARRLFEQVGVIELASMERDRQLKRALSALPSIPEPLRMHLRTVAVDLQQRWA